MWTFQSSRRKGVFFFLSLLPLGSNAAIGLFLAFFEVWNTLTINPNISSEIVDFQDGGVGDIQTQIPYFPL